MYTNRSLRPNHARKFKFQDKYIWPKGSDFTGIEMWPSVSTVPVQGHACMHNLARCDD